MPLAVRGKARASHHRGASETLWLLLLTGKKASPAVRSKKLGFRMSRDNVNVVFYEETYHPIKAGSIDGTDFVPHDIAVYRAYLCFSVLLYDPLGDPNPFGNSYSLAALSTPPVFLTNPSNTGFARKYLLLPGSNANIGGVYVASLPCLIANCTPSGVFTNVYFSFSLSISFLGYCQVQSFFAVLKALSRKEVHYGAYWTSEQVNTAGDLCTIWQEKMHAPILLRCKLIFCEDCVSEWVAKTRMGYGAETLD
ncbi:hypothetical protein L484_015224 [Morus notabilis]|uniref:Uncharacterized protein n=1 Tax=Morus notabilis TaxID=981085 RepID=W9S2N7_9ROSA|nr:hypothetical protein L484_015224 [Morus notabilis]